MCAQILFTLRRASFRPSEACEYLYSPTVTMEVMISERPTC